MFFRLRFEDNVCGGVDVAPPMSYLPVLLCRNFSIVFPPRRNFAVAPMPLLLCHYCFAIAPIVAGDLPLLVFPWCSAAIALRAIRSLESALGECVVSHAYDGKIIPHSIFNATYGYITVIRGSHLNVGRIAFFCFLHVQSEIHRKFHDIMISDSRCTFLVVANVFICDAVWYGTVR
jgi:hypothetical protein